MSRPGLERLLLLDLGLVVPGSNRALNDPGADTRDQLGSIDDTERGRPYPPVTTAGEMDLTPQRARHSRGRVEVG
ncbi:MAG: hypothetical protein ACPGT2_10565, partial [Ilumatobacteraceae bacterium]